MLFFKILLKSCAGLSPLTHAGNHPSIARSIDNYGLQTIFPHTPHKKAAPVRTRRTGANFVLLPKEDYRGCAPEFSVLFCTN